MNGLDPLAECADAIRKRGLTAAAILFLESSKPCIGLVRETFVAATPVLTLFLGESRLVTALSSLKTAEDVERLIGYLEVGGARAN